MIYFSLLNKIFLYNIKLKSTILVSIKYFNINL